MKQISFIKTTALVFAITCSLAASAQIPDHIYKPNIHAVKLFRAGDIYSYPIINLNGAEVLELHFDDMEAGFKNYYYTFQLCNADWSVAALQSFDYITGFQSNRITTYRNSSIALTRYTHYQALLPDRNCKPSRSGHGHPAQSADIHGEMADASIPSAPPSPAPALGPLDGAH